MRFAAYGILLSTTVFFACGDDDGGQGNNNQNDNGAVCGNGRVEAGEDCDEGSLNSDVAPDGCRTDCRAAFCGDGVRDASELCDQEDLDGQSCTGLGMDGGTLSCGAECTFVTYACSGCGNFAIEGDEACDGTALGGATCALLADLQEGIVSCSPTCEHDVSGCHTCGNGILEGPETCDDNNRTRDDGCADNCQVEALWECHGAPSVCAPICGDGVVLTAEACDEGAANSDAPNASCRTNCLPRRCGDSITDGQHNEICDGTDFPGDSCALRGFHQGALSCSSDCQTVDASDCHEYCGDGIINGPEGCEASDLDGDSCAAHGLLGGPLECADDCSGVDLLSCRVVLITEVKVGAVNWIELLNVSTIPVPLSGWVLGWWGEVGEVPASGSITLPSYALQPGARVVIRDDSANTGANPDVSAGVIQLHVKIDWGGGYQGALAVYDVNARALDFVRWNGCAQAPPTGTAWTEPPRGLYAVDEATLSLSRIPETTDTDSAADFCLTTATEGAANGTCIAIHLPGSILITEIDGASPDRIELYNPGPAAVNLLNWQIVWYAGGGVNPPDGSYPLPDFSLAAGAYVLISDTYTSGPQVVGGEILVPQITWAASYRGTCILVEPVYGMGVDYVAWAGGWADKPEPPDLWTIGSGDLGPLTDGQSLSRGTLVDTDSADDWCLQGVKTPGAANPTCP